MLFVSQKTAALEVVQRRLRDIGLGEYCLEVHSTKAQKSAVLGQLRTAWHERAAPTAEDWHAAAGRLAQLRDELNALVTALHRRRANGTTAHEMFGRVVASHGLFGSVVLEWPGEHSPAQLEALRDLVHEIRTDLVAVGSPSDHPLAGITATEWSPAWRAAVQQAAEAYPGSRPRPGRPASRLRGLDRGSAGRHTNGNRAPVRTWPIFWPRPTHRWVRGSSGPRPESCGRRWRSWRHFRRVSRRLPRS